MCEHDVHRIRAPRASSVRPFDRPCQPIRSRESQNSMTPRSDSSCAVVRDCRSACQHSVVREHRFGERARELAEVPAVRRGGYGSGYRGSNRRRRLGARHTPRAPVAHTRGGGGDCSRGCCEPSSGSASGEYSSHALLLESPGRRSPTIGAHLRGPAAAERRPRQTLRRQPHRATMLRRWAVSGAAPCYAARFRSCNRNAKMSK